VAVLGAVVVAPADGAPRAALAFLSRLIPGKRVVPEELATIADDEAVVFAGTVVHRYSGLQPDSEHVAGSLTVRTLPRPPGARLATVATVNDVHFGETACGYLAGTELGPVLAAAPGDDPYPQVMNRAAVAEIAAGQPDAVVAKGDLTGVGSLEQYEQFRDVYATAFGGRLVVTRGNHDNPAAADGPAVPPSPPCQEVTLEGVTLAVLDTSRPGWVGGDVDADQAEWLDELAGRADRPVMVFGHHPVAVDDERLKLLFGADALAASGLAASGTERLAAVVARRPALVGYFAGHTHRNKLRHLPATGPFPWVEVACVKDFPGSWAEYRVFEGGILQVHRRIHADPAALAWSERCRSLYGGMYPLYAFGAIGDRCFQIPLRVQRA
jgi:Icc protein